MCREFPGECSQDGGLQRRTGSRTRPGEEKLGCLAVISKASGDPLREPAEVSPLIRSQGVGHPRERV